MNNAHVALHVLDREYRDCAERELIMSVLRKEQ